MTDEGYLKTKEDLLPYELACGMYYGPPNGEPLKIYRENAFGEWNTKSEENKSNENNA